MLPALLLRRSILILVTCGPALLVEPSADAAPPDMTDHRWCGHAHDQTWLRQQLLSGERRGPTNRVARSVRNFDIGEIAVIEDDGTLIVNNVTRIFEIADAFYATHSDEYDHMIAFIGSNFAFDIEPESGFAFFIQSSGHTAGLNTGRGEFREDIGLNRVKGFINMNDLAEYPDDLTMDFFGSNVASSVEILGHEFLHAWAAFTQTDLADILGRGNAHWSFFLHHPGEAGDASVMEGNRWSNFAFAQFVTVESFTGYSQLDEYLMGLRGPETVEPFFAIDPSDPQANDAAFPRPLVPATGLRINLTVDDIVSRHGIRLPDVTASQKHFKAAFVLVIPQGGVTLQSDLDKLNAFRLLFETWFAEATEGLGSVETTLFYPPGVAPFTHTIDFEDGTLDPAIWEYVQGVTIDDLGTGETSGVRSMRLDGLWGRGDEIRSRMFDLSGFSVQDDQRIALRYHVNRGGAGTPPNADEQLHVEYWSSDGEWVRLQSLNESGASTSSFVQFTERLPARALHEQFRFRFHRLQGRGSGEGNWFIDDLSLVLVDTPRCAGDVNGDGMVDGADLGRIITDFNTAGGGSGGGDLNGDGVVDFRDLIIVLGNFERACP